jgi:hypothetical protein
MALGTRVVNTYVRLEILVDMPPARNMLCQLLQRNTWANVQRDFTHLQSLSFMS